MSLGNIKTFKRIFNNFEYYPTMSIDVYTFEDDEKSNFYAELEIDLSFYKNRDNFDYVYVTDISELVGSQLAKHEHKNYLCRSCLPHFYTNKDLFNHLETNND